MELLETEPVIAAVGCVRSESWFVGCPWFVPVVEADALVNECPVTSWDGRWSCSGGTRSGRCDGSRGRLRGHARGRTWQYLTDYTEKLYNDYNISITSNEQSDIFSRRVSLFVDLAV